LPYSTFTFYPTEKPIFPHFFPPPFPLGADKLEAGEENFFLPFYTFIAQFSIFSIKKGKGERLKREFLYPFYFFYQSLPLKKGIDQNLSF
jgi:hypothetical protein